MVITPPDAYSTASNASGSTWNVSPTTKPIKGSEATAPDLASANFDAATSTTLSPQKSSSQSWLMRRFKAQLGFVGALATLSLLTCPTADASQTALQNPTMPANLRSELGPQSVKALGQNTNEPLLQRLSVAISPTTDFTLLGIDQFSNVGRLYRYVQDTTNDFGTDYAELSNNVGLVSHQPLIAENINMHTAPVYPPELLSEYHQLTDKKFSAGLNTREVKRLREVKEQFNSIDRKSAFVQENLRRVDTTYSKLVSMDQELDSLIKSRNAQSE